MWRDFPRASRRSRLPRPDLPRPDYGRSSPGAAGEAWWPDFVHRQAHGVLPHCRPAWAWTAWPRHPWLFGLGGGARRAAVGRTLARGQRRGDRAAPHFVVEELAAASLAKAREAYLGGDLRRGSGLRRRRRLGVLGFERRQDAAAVPPWRWRTRSARYDARCSPWWARTTSTAHASKIHGDPAARAADSVLLSFPTRHSVRPDATVSAGGRLEHDLQTTTTIGFNDGDLAPS